MPLAYRVSQKSLPDQSVQPVQAWIMGHPILAAQAGIWGHPVLAVQAGIMGHPVCRWHMQLEFKTFLANSQKSKQRKRFGQRQTSYIYKVHKMLDNA